MELAKHLLLQIRIALGTATDSSLCFHLQIAVDEVNGKMIGGGKQG